MSRRHLHKPETDARSRRRPGQAGYGAARHRPDARLRRSQAALASSSDSAIRRRPADTAGSPFTLSHTVHMSLGSRRHSYRPGIVRSAGTSLGAGDDCCGAGGRSGVLFPPACFLPRARAPQVAVEAVRSDRRASVLPITSPPDSVPGRQGQHDRRCGASPKQEVGPVDRWDGARRWQRCRRRETTPAFPAAGGTEGCCASRRRALRSPYPDLPAVRCHARRGPAGSTDGPEARQCFAVRTHQAGQEADAGGKRLCARTPNGSLGGALAAAAGKKR